MIAILDYGVGNLFSLKSSLNYIGFDSVITGDAEVIKSADKIILPGVGAFGDAKRKLDRSGLVDILNNECIVKQKPLLGICLGMQLLFEKSYEYGEHTGLCFIKGEVVPFKLPPQFKVPHMGWNALKIVKPSPILSGINSGDYVYYVHSFYVQRGESTVGVSDYQVEISGVVEKDNIFGTQFHPEKSGDVGLEILKAFCKLS